MRYKPKSIAALHVALGGLPEKMRVEVEADIGASPKTVGELRRMAAWPENLAITIPQERDSDSAVKVASHRRRRRFQGMCSGLCGATTRNGLAVL
jgi:hypothetical protein